MKQTLSVVGGDGVRRRSVAVRSLRMRVSDGRAKQGSSAEGIRCPEDRNPADSLW